MIARAALARALGAHLWGVLGFYLAVWVVELNLQPGEEVAPGGWRALWAVALVSAGAGLLAGSRIAFRVGGFAQAFLTGTVFLASVEAGEGLAAALLVLSAVAVLLGTAGVARRLLPVVGLILFAGAIALVLRHLRDVDERFALALVVPGALLAGLSALAPSPPRVRGRPGPPARPPPTLPRS